MVNASLLTPRSSLINRSAYDKQIIARGRTRVQQQGKLWFPTGGLDPTNPERRRFGAAFGRARARQKRAAVTGGYEVDNREASNRVDRSHSVSKPGQHES